MGIEPTRPAWKAGILPLNYTRIWLITVSYQQRLYIIALFFAIVKHFSRFFSKNYEKIFILSHLPKKNGRELTFFRCIKKSAFIPLLFLFNFVTICYIKNQAIRKKRNPERNKSIHKYTLRTPKSGIKIISTSSVLRHLNKNIQTYTVIAPPSAPVMSNLPKYR